VRRADNLTTFMCRLSRNLGASNSWNPEGLSRPVMGLLYLRDIIAVCSEIHTKHINTRCGQNVEFVNVKPGGTCSNHWALKG
jgi:hypothetical protein